MRCSCKKCGTYMVQMEQGLLSGCKCPDCGEICRDCMGSRQKPLAPDELAARFDAGVQDSVPPASEEELREQAERPMDWRSML